MTQDLLDLASSFHESSTFTIWHMIREANKFNTLDQPAKSETSGTAMNDNSELLPEKAKPVSRKDHISSSGMILEALHDDLRAQAQLHKELSFYSQQEVLTAHHQTHPDGVLRSPLYGLPAEVRRLIFSHVVVHDKAIHIFNPFDNAQHGFRLAICGEESIKPDHGRCVCDNGGRYRSALTNPPAPPAFLDHALLLVSATVRREVADLLFSLNTFVFTDMSDICAFTRSFTTSAARIQNIALYDRCDDWEVHSYRRNEVRAARRALPSLQRLKVTLYISDWTMYENVYEDGFLEEITCFGKPPVRHFEGLVRWTGSYGRSSEDEKKRLMRERVQEKLRKIMTGHFAETGIPMQARPKAKVRDEDKPLVDRRGILVMRD